MTLSPMEAMCPISELNTFIQAYKKGADNKPRSWDDTLLFRKYQEPTGLSLQDRTRNAVVKFATNRKRLAVDSQHLLACIDNSIHENTDEYAQMLCRAREIIHNSLRHLSRWTIHKQVDRHCAFPSGAGFCTKRNETRNKRYHNGISVTKKALTYSCKHLRTDIYLPNDGVSAEKRHINIVTGNRFITVPKDTETERLICIEPEVNSYYQKGIGSWLKGVILNSFGVDLSTQDRNRLLCSDFAYSTIDLRSASDSVMYGLVKFLFPRRVFCLLDAFRCPSSQMFDVSLTHDEDYHVFTTMGNGFTFELETLVFLALAYAAQESCNLPTDDVTVFGDDIIVRNEAAERTINLLSFAGFEVNTKKSFCGAERYRESCGFFYEQVDGDVQLVSPLAIKGAFIPSWYVKCRGKDWEKFPTDPELIRVHNEMVRFITTTNMSYRNDKLARFYRAVIRKIRSLYPSGAIGRGYYGETRYLIADIPNRPLFEYDVERRQSVAPEWSTRLLGHGLMGPPRLPVEGSAFFRKIKKRDEHRSSQNFGGTAINLTEISDHVYLKFHPDHGRFCVNTLAN